MYYRICLLGIMLLVPFLGFSQSSNWNSVINLNVSVNSSDRIDLFTDKDGNHVIVQKYNQLEYYLFSATGTQIRTSVRDNNVSEDPSLSRIVGWEGKLYIIYKEGNKIKTQKSTDAGASWSTSAVQEITMSNSTSNGIDAWTDGNGVHLVYAEFDNSNGVYKTLYQRNNGINSSWIEQKDVTDETNVSGGFPSVTSSGSRVHIGYTNGSDTNPITNRGDETRSRDKVINGSWQSSQNIQSSPQDFFELNAVITTGSKLHGFYYDGTYFAQGLYHKTRDLTGSSWSGSATYISASYVGYKIDMSVTANDKLHIVYPDLSSGELKYNEWSGSWSSSDYSFTSEGAHQQIAANSNDVYVLWIDDDNETLKLRQRDFAPLAPVNLVRSISSSHPRIDWDANAEADLDEYEVWKKKGSGSWGLLATTGNDYYVDATESGVSLYPQVNNIEIKYKLKAVDQGSNASDYSAEVTFNQSGGGLDKKGSPNDDALPKVFALEQNYPNPFNPSTAIRYSLPEATHITLTVYNLSGETVATLVNGEQAAGSYDTVFDASGLPSGVYLYRLTTPVVSQSRKMMILK